MAAEQSGREREMVLGPTEYATVLDETKGNITSYVGPHKTSLSNTDRPVVFEPIAGNFKGCELAQAIRVFPTADEGAYIVLTNPAEKSAEAHPKSGTSNASVKLDTGRKISIPGPASFPLWPGQTATVIPGHRLRSNQYLVVRVYNDVAATENWDKAVMKPQTSIGAEDKSTKTEGLTETLGSSLVSQPKQLTMGQLLVIRGNEVSFYIPPTGVEVVQDARGQYVRDAVTLEQLEYCILLDENGKNRYVTGPAVVFPAPTEMFVERDGSRKFRAIELNENMGLYLKVIAPYADENGDKHEAGEELFITGREQKLYFPRPEHSILKYGDEEIHFAVAIPAGDARYVLDKRTGAIQLEKGPQMFLADPRHQVLVRRVIDPKTIELWYPGNTEARDYNARLAALTRSTTEEFVSEMEALGDLGAEEPRFMAAIRSSGEVAKRGFAGKAFERRPGFTPPRTVTLDTKYDGAIGINVWTGYAIQVVSKVGNRRVVEGPASVLLEYDETLEVLEMSTGSPKTDARLARTVYLRVLNNKVSDQVEAETSDLVRVNVRLSYRVNFEGENSKWFAVENYVKLLTDHLRSMIRSAVKQHGIEKFNAEAISIIRDTVLGASISDEEAGAKSRPGRSFTENGMRVYDVEVLDVEIGDARIAELLMTAQHDSVSQALAIATAERGLAATRRLEEINRGNASARAETERLQIDLKQQRVIKELALALEELGKKAKTREEEQVIEEAEVGRSQKIEGVRLAMKKAVSDQELAEHVAKQDLELAKLTAEVQGVVERAKAFGPEVVEALSAFADKDLAGKMAESMAPLAILGGKSVAEILNRLLKGTVVEHAISALGRNNGNGGLVQEPATPRHM